MQAKGNDDKFRLGQFWLDRRADSPYWQICWCTKEGARYRTHRSSTGERDFEGAKGKLAEHYIANVKLRDENPESVPICLILDRWYERHASKLASHESVKIAIARWREFWGNDNIDGLTLERQDEFEKWLRERTFKRGQMTKTLSGGAVARIWNVGPAALEWARKQHQIRYYPSIRTLSDDARRQRILTLDESAALLNAAATTEHLWRWALLAFGTACRPNAILELRASMIDLDSRRLSLLPPDRRQDPKKRRPVVPIAATLLPWLRMWTSREAMIHHGKGGRVVELDRLITYRGRRISTIRMGFQKLKKRAGLTDPEIVPYTIRHTMTTWMVRQRVPEWDREVFVGHKAPGSRTTAGYVHLDPDYLRSAADAVDAYFAALAPMMTRPLGLRASCAPAGQP